MKEKRVLEKLRWLLICVRCVRAAPPSGFIRNFASLCQMMSFTPSMDWLSHVCVHDEFGNSGAFWPFCVCFSHGRDWFVQIFYHVVLCRYNYIARGKSRQLASLGEPRCKASRKQASFCLEGSLEASGARYASPFDGISAPRPISPIVRYNLHQTWSLSFMLWSLL